MAIIETQNLTKFYGKTRGIERVSLEITEGEIFGFIGPNGAGKSTTIRLLLNFLFPSAGSATVFGLDIVKNSREIRAAVGYLPGELSLYEDMRVRELLDYSARFYRRDCARRAKDLTGILDLDPAKPVRSLSLGNKKKLGIILSLLHEPKLLMLDEPTSGLDPLMQKTFYELLRKENENGTTIFFSSHVLSEVQRLCHRVGIIKEGRILKVEKLDTLRSNQFRKVRVALTEDKAPLDIPGLLHAVQENGLWQVLYKGDVNVLIGALAQHRLENVWLEEPNLEEIFLHYYEKGEEA